MTKGQGRTVRLILYFLLSGAPPYPLVPTHLKNTTRYRPTLNKQQIRRSTPNSWKKKETNDKSKKQIRQGTMVGLLILFLWCGGGGGEEEAGWGDRGV